MESKFYSLLDGLILLHEAYSIIEAENVTIEDISRLEQMADQIKDFIATASDKISDFQTQQLHKPSAEKIDPTLRSKINMLKNDLQKMISRSNDLKKYLDLQKAKIS